MVGDPFLPGLKVLAQDTVTTGRGASKHGTLTVSVFPGGRANPIGAQLAESFRGKQNIEPLMLDAIPKGNLSDQFRAAHGGGHLWLPIMTGGLELRCVPDVPTVYRDELSHRWPESGVTVAFSAGQNFAERRVIKIEAVHGENIIPKDENVPCVLTDLVHEAAACYPTLPFALRVGLNEFSAINTLSGGGGYVHIRLMR